MRKNIFNTLLIIVFLFIISFCFYLYSNYKKEQKYYLDKKRYEIKIAYKTLLQTYGLVSKTIYNEVINKPNIIKVFSEAYHAEKPEREIARKKLYKLLYHTYNNLKTNNLRQLHFHFPDNTSFLRFHKPERYGDDLTDIRYSVYMTNKDKIYNFGFEEGRIFNGFRYVFPLFDKEVHIGSVECSISFQSLNEEMKKIFQKDFHFLLNKKIMQEKVFKELQSFYITSALSNRYVTEKIIANYSRNEIIPNTDKKKLQTKNQSLIKKGLAEKKDFSVYHSFAGKTIIANFITIPNVEDKKVAYLIAYEYDFVLSRYKSEFIFNVLLSNALFFTILVVTYFGQKYHLRIKEAKEQAEAGLRSRTQFLSAMSHEIRTPMNAVIGMIDLLYETNLDTEQLDYVKTIHVSGDNLLTIINDILDFSKIESGKIQLEKTVFCLRTIIENILDMLAPRAIEKDIELYYSIEPEISDYIFCDATRLRQILINLIGNSIKFTFQGYIYIKVINLSDHVQFLVEDTGIGIDEAYKLNIFESFSQQDASTARKYGGTGLGLTISKQLVELMNGKIWFESEKDKGTNFYFTIEYHPAKKIPEQIYPIVLEKSFSISAQILYEDDKFFSTIESFCKNLNMSYKKSLVSKDNFSIDMIGSEGLILLQSKIINQLDIGIIKNFLIAINNKKLGLILFDSVGLSINAIENMEDVHKEKFYSVKSPYKLVTFYEAIVSFVEKKNYSMKEKNHKRNKIDKELARTYPANILVAEDNQINQKLIETLLKKMGYKPTIVANGIEVLQAITQKKYNIILMDIQMPEMDGMRATEVIVEKIPKHKRPIIIALTANAMASDRKYYLSKGMNDYLMKPLYIEALQETIKKWISH